MRDSNIPHNPSFSEVTVSNEKVTISVRSNEDSVQNLIKLAVDAVSVTDEPEKKSNAVEDYKKSHKAPEVYQ